MSTTDDKSTSLSVQLKATLQERIIRGQYPQGMRLREQRLAEDLSVSRIPLRETLSQLEVDGLIRAEHYRGAIVATWTPKMVNDLFDVRLALETTAAQLAARACSQGVDSAPLRVALAGSQAAVAGDDNYAIAEMSVAFHSQIVALTGNDIMASLMRSVAGRTIWLFYLTSSRDPSAACEEHQRLLEAVESGNTRVAEAVAYAHIERGRVPSLRALFS